MEIYKFKMRLLSDTTFGRGDGVAGLVDQEVEHDVNGFPYLRGRTLKGLLSEECDNVISVLGESSSRWQVTAENLFGVSGSTLGTTSKMHVSDAYLPGKLREAVGLQLKQEEYRERNNSGYVKKLTEFDVLSSLTTIRRQTAIDTVSGVPVKTSLRTSRVIVRDLCFTAELFFEDKPTQDMLALLALGALALRRVGSGRNRGRGFVCCTLHNFQGVDVTQKHFRDFEQGV
ncbi:hypothetical protein DSM106972_088240 [Dulcicalothrix desertica PCC 7102]|uniref:CRISPR type III-associated protein domain-containing protein n=2 Tax=Dulcicalothrix desertica TaxID=32056 RepID=A0A3S1IEB4_9CYAN|nr:RAMP superfamily CRISPR-associated protein [Dulcicalothrix desertica]RUS96153.1 hypothetical protein DSM106972_088240 [Dulcicalothrix desertica PCC 7102]TWH53909.1 RAMP superfamily protein [Dulcicalothrix desertica PCC 7102]